MTKYSYSDLKDVKLCDKAFNYNAWLLFGKNNSNRIEAFKTFFDEHVESISTVPFGSNGKYITTECPGICKLISDDNSHFLLEMAGYRNATTKQYSWLLHEFPHEYCHAFAHLVPQFFSSSNGKIINDDEIGNIKCNNSMGLIRESDPKTGRLIGTHYYGKMVTETMMDIITTAGLIAFEPGFATNNVTVDTVFEKHYDNWNDVHTGYSIFTSITRLLVAAFSNNGYVKYQTLVNQGSGIFDVVTETRTGKKLKANDFLYGIMYNHIHIQDEFDKFMGSGLYRLLSKVLDQNFEKCKRTGKIPPDTIEAIKLVMDYVPDFLNKKCQYYLTEGMYTVEQTTKIVSSFNMIWNSLQTEYKAYFSQEEINDIARRAGHSI